MCQLLGMNCNVPTDICFSFKGFAARGGRTDQHSDGWGIAFFEERGLRTFLDDRASVSSAIAELVQSYPIRSKHVVAHIRKATRGPISLANCHPFQRELWGRYWVFAHNGTLTAPPVLDGSWHQPVGDTDSERAFCFLLHRLRELHPREKPPLDELADTLARLAAELVGSGTFNFLLSDGEQLWAHCSTKLAYVVRQAPFHTAHLLDEDVTVDFSKVTGPADRVAVIATVPLTDDEPWTQVPPGTLLAFADGHPVLERQTALPPPAPTETADAGSAP